MDQGQIEMGEFNLSLLPTQSTGAWFVREQRDMVEGNVSTYIVQSEKYNLYAEIEEIELINGSKWIIVGESFSGPKWVYGQLEGRLRISINEKNGNFFFDLTIPTPGNRNPDAYTASRCSVAEISSIYPNFSVDLHNHGAREIGLRSDLLSDNSTRKGHLCVTMSDKNNHAPILGFLLSRIIPLCQEFDRLANQGAITDDRIENKMDRRSSITKDSGNQSLTDIIAAGESVFVEFKPAIWYNHGQAMNNPSYKFSKDRSVSDNVIRTVAGFLNSEGGTLFVGVGDDGSSYGIEKDIQLTGRGDMDGLENELMQMLNSAIPKEIVATKLKINFPKYQGKTIVSIEVERSNTPVFMKLGHMREKFFVRIGNATNTMSVESAFNYISEHNWVD